MIVVGPDGKRYLAATQAQADQFIQAMAGG